MSIPEPLALKLNNCSSLITLPAIALKVIDMAEDPDIGLSEIEKVISNDPALSAKLVRVANSPLFARTKNIESILQALTLLGLDSALSLALSFSLMGAMQKNDKKLDSHKFWQRSIISAVTARELGVRLKLHNQGALFLAGLLQDLGILALTQLDSDSYPALFAASTSHTALRESEEQIYGCDHAAIGAYLGESWRLPNLLIEAIDKSHQLQKIDKTADEQSRFLHCIALSALLSDLWLIEQPQHNSQISDALHNLGLNEEQIEEMLNAIMTQLPELSKLFEVELIDSGDVEAVLARSKEVLMIRDMHKEMGGAKSPAPEKFAQQRSRNLDEIAKRDSLSGLYNRAHLDKILKMEYENANSDDGSLSLVFFDIDHFKRINDNYGHKIGDVVIKSIARLIEQLKRQTDVAARFGGEEFMLVMPGSDSRAAQVIAQRIVDALNNMPLDLGDDLRLAITVSAGISTHSANHRFKSAERMIKAADVALYQSKQGGRNRVSVFRSSYASKSA